MLWDYLAFVISNWKGEVIIMGDFNEVRNKDERFGLCFNKQGAEAFNMFIANTSLEEVSLGGCTFTWCHKSATKMSKLDRFLISESLMSSCPNLSAVSLDRYLSDHRPILLRDTSYDYGPTLFRFFHSWFEMEGLDKFVIKEKKRLSNISKVKLQEELCKLDITIDKGEGTEDVVNRRSFVCKSLQDMENIKALDAAQKAKIKWAIEGDDNSKYYHGILNKKRSQSSIRGVLVDGNWIKSPCSVKSEFFSHFKIWFEQPQETRIHINMNFPNTIMYDQKEDLESMVSKEEIKRAVWECGTDKSSGPDGFTFGFYRRFWKVIEKDVVEAVTFFFCNGYFPKG
ncbi:RNA-directed DNA polymerase, eukaryota, partial [Tanacetum coccineum]